MGETHQERAFRATQVFYLAGVVTQDGGSDANNDQQLTIADTEEHRVRNNRVLAHEIAQMCQCANDDAM